MHIELFLSLDEFKPIDLSRPMIPHAYTHDSIPNFLCFFFCLLIFWLAATIESRNSMNPKLDAVNRLINSLQIYCYNTIAYTSLSNEHHNLYVYSLLMCRMKFEKKIKAKFKYFLCLFNSYSDNFPMKITEPNQAKWFVFFFQWNFIYLNIITFFFLKSCLHSCFGKRWNE